MVSGMLEHTLGKGFSTLGLDGDICGAVSSRETVIANHFLQPSNSVFTTYVNVYYYQL